MRFLIARSPYSVRQWLSAISFGLLAVAICSCQRSTDTIPSATLDATSGVVTFARDVAPIIFKRCAACHHPGEAAPFSLLSYDDVRRRARQIIDVTRKRFMPPWLPTQGDEQFVGTRRLTDHELQTLQGWVDAGAPRGDESELPAAPVFTDGWQTGTPDLVLESPAFKLSSGGGDVFRNFVVPIQLESPRWVQSIELRPENPRVTHHARLGVDRSGESLRRESNDGQPGYAGMAWGQDPDGQLVIWAPGMVAKPGTPGIAWRLYPDTCLVLHTHMQPSGKTESVKFRIGVHFADKPPEQHPAILRIGSCDIDIPAGAPHHVVSGEYVLPIDVDVHTIFPHAHSLCRELRAVAELADGSRQPLISIEHFDENWHEAYDYCRPLRLPQGTHLFTTFTYDNTDANLRNRSHPARRVVYGSNVSDEMADIYLQVTPVHPDQRAVLMEHYKEHELKSQIIGLGKSLDVYPDDPWILEGIAACDVGLERPGEAIAVLQRRLKTGSVAVFPVVSLGMAFFANRDYALAEGEFHRALSMDDKYALAWLGLGRTLIAEKQSGPAENAYRQAVKLTPSLLDARLALVDLMIGKGQLEEAAAACSAAIGDSPDMPAVYLKLAEIRAKQRRYQESLDACAEAQRLAPYTHPPKVLLAVFCIQNGDVEQGLALLREAHAEFPDHPMPALLMGQVARSQDRADEARKYLGLAASLPIPENWPTSHRRRFLVLLHSERFQLAQQLQDTELARDSVSQWLKADPENPRLRAIYDEMQVDSSR
jgi:tetratricopeptide (TPR) repeat protein